MGLDHPGLTISHEAIYQYISHPQTEGRRERQTKIPNRIPIERRPAGVDSRRQCGHWEEDSLVSRLAGLPKRARRTLTLDNGTENASRQERTSRIGLRCYFAHPYASWERGTCEHSNALSRWCLPKGTDFSTSSEEQIAQIESLINNRPGKCLGFQTPIEVATPRVALQG